MVSAKSVYISEFLIHFTYICCYFLSYYYSNFITLSIILLRVVRKLLALNLSDSVSLLLGSAISGLEASWRSNLGRRCPMSAGTGGWAPVCRTSSHIVANSASSERYTVGLRLLRKSQLAWNGKLLLQLLLEFS